MSSAAVAFPLDESSWAPPTRPAVIRLEYTLSQYPASWEIDEEESMPESNAHHEMVVYLESLLKAWVERSERAWLVGSNLAIRWDEQSPNVGVDPDVYVAPMPPEGHQVESLCLWKQGHYAPRLAIEIVSPRYARKDYEHAPEKYAACGVHELWVVDPELSGPKEQGGPYVLQVWRREERGSFRRVYAGAGPVYSDVLQAWATASPRRRQIYISDDRDGIQRWLTEAQEQRRAKEQERRAKELALQKERQAKEQERQAKEQERLAKDEALKLVAKLQAEIMRIKNAQ